MLVAPLLAAAATNEAPRRSLRALSLRPSPSFASPRRWSPPLPPSARDAMCLRGGAIALEMSSRAGEAAIPVEKARGGAVVEGVLGGGGKALRIATSLFGWYFLNAVFAIMNKKTLLCFPHPWLTA
ncbi:hypothetical protein ACHAWF_007138 [Thalassiosira exigua]